MKIAIAFEAVHRGAGPSLLGLIMQPNFCFFPPYLCTVKGIFLYFTGCPALSRFFIAVME